MKLNVRRRPPQDADQRPAAPRPPRGRPVVAYAGVLDGHTLWVALEARPGSIALRDCTTGDVAALRSDLTEDQTGYTSVRVDLDTLVDASGRRGEAAYDVVLVPPGSGTPQPAWSAPLPERPLSTPPPAPGGQHTYALARTEDGTLRVQRRPLAPLAALVGVEVRSPDVHLSIATPGPADGVHLLLLDPDDTVLATLPVTAHAAEPGEHAGTAATVVEALVGVDQLPAGYHGVLRVAVGTGEHPLRVRRVHNGLGDPGPGVLLPELLGEDGERVAARFRWSPDALLVVRVLDPDEGATP